ncbi:MAG: hypothetical protein MZV70_67865 [Desulfobacterales bacterium]|nr:hypothetical protein [Desulfobacterales bacterium]
MAEQGVQATVVDGRFVKPLDAALIVDLARRIPRIVTVEENVRQGGFGSAVLEALNDAGIRHVAVERIGHAGHLRGARPPAAAARQVRPGRRRHRRGRPAPAPARRLPTRQRPAPAADQATPAYRFRERSAQTA